MVKNLLFVAKVIHLISPESETTAPQEGEQVEQVKQVEQVEQVEILPAPGEILYISSTYYL